MGAQCGTDLPPLGPAPRAQAVLFGLALAALVLMLALSLVVAVMSPDILLRGTSMRYATTLL